MNEANQWIKCILRWRRIHIFIQKKIVSKCLVFHIKGTLDTYFYLSLITSTTSFRRESAAWKHVVHFSPQRNRLDSQSIQLQPVWPVWSKIKNSVNIASWLRLYFFFHKWHQWEKNNTYIFRWRSSRNCKRHIGIHSECLVSDHIIQWWRLRKDYHKIFQTRGKHFNIQLNCIIFCKCRGVCD